VRNGSHAGTFVTDRYGDGAQSVRERAPRKLDGSRPGRRGQPGGCRHDPRWRRRQRRGGLRRRDLRGQPTASLSITHGTISANTAQSGAGGAGGVSGGGAGGPGDAPRIVTSPIVASVGGGGVFDSNASLSVVASALSGNKAIDGAGGPGGAGASAGGSGGDHGQTQCRAEGGGMLVGGINAVNAVVAISGSTISGNTAQSCAGGQGGTELSDSAGEPGGGGGGGDGAPADGGAIVSVAGQNSLTRSMISNNQALSGKPADRGPGGAGGSVTSGMGVHGGSGGNGGGGGGASQGGGIAGSFTVTDSTFSSNIARGADAGTGGNCGAGGTTSALGQPGGPGGGGGSGGLGSPADGGGLIASPLVFNTTLVGNAVTGGRGGNAGAGRDGGAGPGGTGLHGPAGVGGPGANARGGGLELDSFGRLTNDTIDGNSATGGTLGLGDPIGAAGSGSAGGAFLNSTTIANTIVAQETVSGLNPTAPDCGTPSGGHVLSAGHNLRGASDGCNGIANGVNGDQAGNSLNPLNALLAAPANNGGPTPTMAEQPPSPGIGHGNPTTCTSTDVGDKDQRGYPRLSASRGACDAGAYDSAEPARLTVSAPASATRGASLSITVTPRTRSPTP
jgi:hypothetical protein